MHEEENKLLHFGEDSVRVFNVYVSIPDLSFFQYKLTRYPFLISCSSTNVKKSK